MDGSLYWNAGHGTGYPAVADLDGDGKTERRPWSEQRMQSMRISNDGTLLWGPKDVNNGVADSFGSVRWWNAHHCKTSTGMMPDGQRQEDGYLVPNGQNGSVLWQSTATTDTSRA